MTTRGAAEVLYETEATLRLVGNVLDELEVIGVDLGKSRSHRELSTPDDEAEASVSDLTPLRVYREVQEVLRSIRHSRTILDRTSEEKNTIRPDVVDAAACLRLYDITEQQLSYAASVLLDMEDRFTQLARMLDPQGHEAIGAGVINHRSQMAQQFSA